MNYYSADPNLTNSYSKLVKLYDQIGSTLIVSTYNRVKYPNLRRTGGPYPMELNMRAQTQKVADQSSHHHSDAYAAERPTPPRMLAAAAA